MDASVNSASLCAFDLAPGRGERQSTKSLLYHRFCKQFASSASLSPTEISSLLPEGGVWACPAGKVLVRQGSLSTKPRIVLSGWACSQQILKNGRRQIFSLFLPGDFIAFDQLSRPSPANVVALSSMVLADASELLRAGRMPDRFPQLAEEIGAIERRQMIWLYHHIR